MVEEEAGPEFHQSYAAFWEAGRSGELRKPSESGETEAEYAWVEVRRALGEA